MLFTILLALEVLVVAFIVHVVATVFLLTRTLCPGKVCDAAIGNAFKFSFEGALIAAWAHRVDCCYSGGLGPCACVARSVDCAGFACADCTCMVAHGAGAHRARGLLLTWIPRLGAFTLALVSLTLSCIQLTGGRQDIVSSATAGLTTTLAVACSVVACVQLWAVAVAVCRRFCCQGHAMIAVVVPGLAAAVDEIALVGVSAIVAGVWIDAGSGESMQALAIAQALSAVALVLSLAVVQHTSVALFVAFMLAPINDDDGSSSSSSAAEDGSSATGATSSAIMDNPLTSRNAVATDVGDLTDDDEEVDAPVCGAVAAVKAVERSPLCRLACGALCCYRCKRVFCGDEWTTAQKAQRTATAAAAAAAAAKRGSLAAQSDVQVGEEEVPRVSTIQGVVRKIQAFVGTVWRKAFRYRPFRRSLATMLVFCTIEELLFAWIPEVNTAEKHQFAINILADVAITLEDAKLLLGLLPAACCGVQIGISVTVSIVQLIFVITISTAGAIPAWLGLALIHLEVGTELMLLLHMGFLAPYEHEELSIVAPQWRDAPKEQALALALDAEEEREEAERLELGGRQSIVPPSLDLIRRASVMLAPFARTAVGTVKASPSSLPRSKLQVQLELQRVAVAAGNASGGAAITRQQSAADIIIRQKSIEETEVETEEVLKKYSSFNAIFDSLMGAFMGLFLILPSFISRDFESNSTWAAILLIAVFFVYEGMVLLLRRRARHADFKEGLLFISFLLQACYLSVLVVALSAANIIFSSVVLEQIEVEPDTEDPTQDVFDKIFLVVNIVASAAYLLLFIPSSLGVGCIYVRSASRYNTVAESILRDPTILKHPARHLIRAIQHRDEKEAIRLINVAVVPQDGSPSDINWPDPKCSGATSLHLAVRYKMIGVVKHLLVHGAEFDTEDNRGHTAFLEAVSHGHIEIAAVLLDNGAKIDVRDHAGE